MTKYHFQQFCRAIPAIALPFLLIGCVTNTQGANSKTETEITIPGLGSAKWGSSVKDGNTTQNEQPKSSPPPSHSPDALLEKMSECLRQASFSYSLDPCTCFEIYKVKPTGTYVRECPNVNSWKDT